MENSSANLSLPYSSLLYFEKDFIEPYFHTWMEDYWSLSLLISALYVALVFGGKHFMRKKQKLDLRPILCIWSGILAVFSVLGAVRTLPSLIYILKNYGFEYSVCQADVYSFSPTAFWSALFTLSKAFELGDTMFIVLRKQQLIFLHWYHHITVFIYVWYFYQFHPSVGMWFMTMNYIVHGVMYPYYTLKAMRFSLPKQVNLLITSMQIAQMLMGLFIGGWIFIAKTRGHSCNLTDTNVLCTLLMYSSYLILFCNFFYSAYMAPKKKVLSTENNNNVISNGISKKTE